MTFDEEYNILKEEHLKKLQNLRDKYQGEKGLDGNYSNEAYKLNTTFFLPKLKELKKKYNKV